MIGAILEILAKGLGIAATWCQGYADKANVKNRIYKDQMEAIDKTREALRKGDINEIRRQIPPQ